MNTKYYWLISCALLSFSTSVVAIDKAGLKKLEQRCDDARQKKIDPLRKAEIKKCAAKDRGTRDALEKCEQYYVTWDKEFPHGCRAMGFKSKLFPSIVIRVSSDHECLLNKKKINKQFLNKE